MPNRPTATEDFNDVRLDQDAMAVVVAFVPDGVEVPDPPSVDEFDENVLNDMGLPVGDDDELFPDIEFDDLSNPIAPGSGGVDG